MKQISIITNIIPKYRQGFYDKFISSDIDVLVYCQKDIPNKNFSTIHESYKFVKTVKYFSIGDEFLIIQFLPLFNILLKSKIIVIDGNPRYVTNVLLSLFAILLNKKVVIWTMAHTFTANKYLERIRLSWTRLFKNIIVYNEAEVMYLRNRGFNNHNIIAINNGLNQTEIDEASLEWDEEKLNNWKVSKGISDKRILLSSTRLLKKNDLDLMMFAFPQLLKKYNDLIWVIIGDGEEMDNLKKLSVKLNIDDKVLFEGEIYDENVLAPYFKSSLCLVHPSSIGLSIMHSFGYGLPVVTNNDLETQGPEYSALKENINGVTFTKGDRLSLISRIEFLITNIAIRNNMSINALSLVRNECNTNIMYQNFNKMISSLEN